MEEHVQIDLTTLEDNSECVKVLHNILFGDDGEEGRIHRILNRSVLTSEIDEIKQRCLKLRLPRLNALNEMIGEEKANSKTKVTSVEKVMTFVTTSFCVTNEKEVVSNEVVYANGDDAASPQPNSPESSSGEIVETKFEEQQSSSSVVNSSSLSSKQQERRPVVSSPTENESDLQAKLLKRSKKFGTSCADVDELRKKNRLERFSVSPKESLTKAKLQKRAEKFGLTTTNTDAERMRKRALKFGTG